MTVWEIIYRICKQDLCVDQYLVSRHWGDKEQKVGLRTSRSIDVTKKLQEQLENFEENR